MIAVRESPCKAAKGILVNFWGTLLMTEELLEVEKYGHYYIIDDERKDGERSYSLDEFLREKEQKYT